MPIEPTARKGAVFPVDLHLHSTASDGTDSPAELLANVRAAGIRTFSVTDHDTIGGALAMEALVPADMTYVRGVEVSCYTEVEKCHILGYAYDPDCPAFQEVLAEGCRRRRAKFDQRVAWLASEHDIVLTAGEIDVLQSLLRSSPVTSNNGACVSSLNAKFAEIGSKARIKYRSEKGFELVSLNE